MSVYKSKALEAFARAVDNLTEGERILLGGKAAEARAVHADEGRTGLAELWARFAHVIAESSCDEHLTMEGLDFTPEDPDDEV